MLQARPSSPVLARRPLPARVPVRRPRRLDVRPHRVRERVAQDEGADGAVGGRQRLHRLSVGSVLLSKGQGE